MDTRRLDSLPVELLYEIHLLALEPSLPCTSKYLKRTLGTAPPSVHAEYILGRISLCSPGRNASGVLSLALRYTLCSKNVLEAILRTNTLVWNHTDHRGPELPRRLFKNLNSKLKRRTLGGTSIDLWTKFDHPLPFLDYLYSSDRFPPPDANAHDGYALTKAVHAEFIPLVQFLLEHGASPKRRVALAVTVAIRRKRLSLVRMLVEPDTSAAAAGEGKRRRVADRVEVDARMLQVAVECGADDIAEWMVREKGCTPNARTLRGMTARSLPLRL